MRRDPMWSNVYVEHEPVDTHPVGHSLTRQEFVEECDINTLMARYANGAAFPDAMAQPQYLDCVDVPDYQTALNIVQEAGEAFSRLPSIARREFDNDPTKFVAFASDPENIGRMREWGLAPPEAVPEPPQRVEVVSTVLPDPGPPAPVK